MTSWSSNADGTVVVHGSDGVDTTFTKDGRLNEVTSTADDLKPAGAKITYDTGTDPSAPVRLVRIQDRLEIGASPAVNPSRSIYLRYNQAGLLPPSGSCPAGDGITLDAAPPAGMLCQIDYPDGTSTRLYYQLVTQSPATGVPVLARISEPGDEGPNPAPEGRQVTDLRWANGQISTVVSSFNNDVIASQGTLPAGQQIAVSDLETDITWANGKPSAVTQPRPKPAPEPRPQMTVSWISPSQTDVSIAGLTQRARSVTFDLAGRVLTDTDALGRVTSYTWASGVDMLLKTSSGGRTSSTVYDQWWHPTDSYGPAPDGCFSTTVPVDPNQFQSFPPNGTCSGTNGMPHTHTDYDHNLSGLQGAYWPIGGFAGQPTAHSMAPGAGALRYTYTGATAPPGISVGDNWSARYSGVLSLPAGGSWAFTLSVAPADTVSVYFDGVKRLTFTGSGTTWGTTTQTISYPVATKLKVRIDETAGVGDSGLAFQWQNATAAPTTVDIPATALKPGLWYPTRTVVDDAGTGVPASATAETRFDENGVDPVYGQATSTTVDPAGLALKTSSGYEVGAGTLRRPTRRTLPAFAAAPTTTNSTTYAYYGDTETRANPCVVGSAAVSQAGLLKTTTGPTPASGGAVTTEMVYDTLGRVVASRYNLETSWTCTTYDSRGRITKVVYPPDGQFPGGRTVMTAFRVGGNPYVTTVSDTSVTGSPNGSTITNVADALGRTVSYTDVWNNTTTSTYDQAGRLTSSTGIAGITSYSYDDGGRLLQEGLGGLTIAVPHYTPLTDTLDPGRMDSIDYPSGTGNAGNGTRGSFTVDGLGRPSGITWTTIATGAAITADQVTRSLTGRILTDTIDGAASPAWTYTYDGAGRLATATGSGHTFQYGFASSGGCGANTAAGSNSDHTSVVDGAVTVATSCFDNADRLVSTTAAGYTGTIAYDSHGNMTQLAGQSLLFDAADRHLATYLPNATSPTTSIQYQRDALNRLVSRTSTVITSGPGTPAFRAASPPAGSAATGTIGGSGATSVSVSRPSGSVTGDVLLAAITIRTGTTPALTAPAGWTAVPGGDSTDSSNVRTVLFWRVAAAGDPTSWTWTLASAKPMVGGIVAYSGVDTASPIDAVTITSHSSSATTHTAPAVTTTSANDLELVAVGLDQTTTEAPAGTSTLVERVDNAATSSNGVTLEMADRTQTVAGSTGTQDVTSAASARDAMVSIALRPGTVTTTTTATQRYVYSGTDDSPDGVLDNTGTMIETTVALPGGVVITRRASGDVWAYPNLHGDTQALANPTGVKLGASFTYDPWGNPLAGVADTTAGSIDNAWLGEHQRPYEHQTGLAPLIEMGARPYSTVLGQFLATDPVEGGTGTSGYGYVSDPINQYDLNGMCFFCMKTLRKIARKSYQAARFVANIPMTSTFLLASQVTGGINPNCGMNMQEIMIVCTASRSVLAQSGGTTYGSLYITRYSQPDPRTMAHEAKHADQWFIFGPGFGEYYLGSSIFLRGSSNPFEIWAGLKDGCYTRPQRSTCQGRIRP